MTLFDEIPDDVLIKMASGVPPASLLAFWSWFLSLLLLIGVLALPVMFMAVSRVQKPSRVSHKQGAHRVIKTPLSESR